VTVAAPVSEPAPPNRVGGFPSQLELWAGFGTEPPAVIDRFDVDVAALVLDDIVADDRWWVSWGAAKDVGLGRIVPLDGRTPADIRVLYVVGVGDAAPAGHFRSQIDAGEMAALPLGAPTNALDAEQAASLGQDPEEWRGVAQERMGGSARSAALTRLLAGPGSEDLPAMPVGEDLPELDAALVHALWPALWGHQLRDVWGCDEEEDRLAARARLYLRPEGALPPVRIDRQPYGLLPASALSEWRVANEEGPLADFERRMQPGLLRMRREWAAAARAAGTAVGADTARLLDLIAHDATSAGYASRTFLAAELWAALYQSTGAADPAAFMDWVRDAFAVVYDLVGRAPEDPPGIRRYVAGGGPAELPIPLVVPSHWPTSFYELDATGTIAVDEHGAPVLRTTAEQALAELLRDLMEVGFRYELMWERWRGVLPDSLLVRLLLHAGVLSAAAVTQTNGGGPAPLREPLMRDSTLPTLLRELSMEYSPGDDHDHPAGDVRTNAMDGLGRLLEVVRGVPPEARPLERIERAFRATLDTAMNRVDPWITGMATRRLEYLRERPEARYRLGVYGWVDGPISVNRVPRRAASSTRRPTRSR
jgi:hypothetical protein